MKKSLPKKTKVVKSKQPLTVRQKLLFKNNRDLACYMASRLWDRSLVRDNGLSWPELRCLCDEGLMRACQCYDRPELASFGTYACNVIYRHVLREIPNAGRLIHIPTHVHTDRIRLSRGRKPAHGSQNRCDAAAKTFNVVSINDVEDRYDGNGNLANKAQHYEWLADKTPPERLDFEQKEIIHDALRFLPPKQREVIRHYYGLNGRRELTLAAIGRKLGLTHARVDQLHWKAIRALSRILYPKRRALA